MAIQIPSTELTLLVDAFHPYLIFETSSLKGNSIDQKLHQSIISNTRLNEKFIKLLMLKCVSLV